jgi:hypothetical protein
MYKVYLFFFHPSGVLVSQCSISVNCPITPVVMMSINNLLSEGKFDDRFKSNMPGADKNHVITAAIPADSDGPLEPFMVPAKTPFDFKKFSKELAEKNPGKAMAAGFIADVISQGFETEMVQLKHPKGPNAPEAN